MANEKINTSSIRKSLPSRNSIVVRDDKSSRQNFFLYVCDNLPVIWSEDSLVLPSSSYSIMFWGKELLSTPVNHRIIRLFSLKL